MDVNITWDFSGFSDAPFAENALSWAIGSGQVVTAVQEYAPGVVAMRNADRFFFVIFDTNRWLKERSITGTHLGQAKGMAFVPQDFLAEGDVDFERLFWLVHQGICPLRRETTWHDTRKAPVLSSQS